MPKDIRKLQLQFDRDPTVATKVIAISNRYSSVARPDLIITESGFLIHSMPKDIRKLQLQFDPDPTVVSHVGKTPRGVPVLAMAVLLSLLLELILLGVAT